MLRPRVVLFEDDPILVSVLLEVFADEDIDVTHCESLAQIQAAVREYPGAVVVSDSWSTTLSVHVGERERSEIEALARTGAVILTTGRAWGARPGAERQFVEQVVVVPKPYDLDRLMAAVRQASAPASSTV